MPTSQSTVTLFTTVHDPAGRQVPLVEAELPRLAALYAALVAFCSQETHPALLAALRDRGVTVHRDPVPSTGIGRLGAVRREALRAGLLAGTPHLHLCDFDRALHWSAHYPGELAEVVAAIPGYDLLVLGRTPRAWASHPPYQAETEPLFNRVFALVTGHEWDIGAGSRGLSRRAAEWLLAESREEGVGIDAEWPLLILGRDGWITGQRLCDGLEFETADRFGAEIEAAGDARAWMARMSADPHRWVYRAQLALDIANAAIRYAPSRPPQTAR